MSTFSIDEFQATTEKLLLDVRAELPAINIRVARTGLSLLRNRIINDGQNSKGESLGSYSTNPLPAYFYEGKGISAGADEKLKKSQKKGKEGVSYKDWREFNGLQTNHIDLKFSGDMWRDIDVISNESSAHGVVTIVGAKNSITRKSGKSSLKTDDLMEFNSDRYGDIMAISQEEENELAMALDAELQFMFDQAFGE